MRTTRGVLTHFVQIFQGMRVRVIIDPARLGTWKNVAQSLGGPLGTQDWGQAAGRSPRDGRTSGPSNGRRHPNPSQGARKGPPGRSKAPRVTEARGLAASRRPTRSSGKWRSPGPRRAHLSEGSTARCTPRRHVSRELPMSSQQRKGDRHLFVTDDDRPQPLRLGHVEK